ncbi:hypothetical protein CFC21_090157 [Triticum aestivum]|uniref:F-box domain-containing protein n=2 Tax=Triticum aestivum TaxID=4565 RepID=A0A9R1LDN1_WHEAT|nr:putative F-box/LRR-repeat protein At4g15060 [Triticum aestivum]KAF7086911.1 hypothetical protein CFC21_090157 [Triticum aestivum]
MDSPSSPAAATPPATGDDCFTMKKWQFKLRKPSPAIRPARRWRVVQSTEPQRCMRDRDAAIMSAAHRLHAHEPPRDTASRCTGSLNKTMCTQDVEQTVQSCDWISILPDDILVKILSLLTVSDAAMTDSLSTRWRHLWKNVDCLILDLYTLRMPESEICYCHQKPCLRKAQVKKFVRKTNGFLRNHHGNRIKEFTVRFPLTSVNASDLDHWIGFAASASTEKLCLDLYDMNRSSCLDISPNEPYNFILSPFSDGRGCRLSELTLSNCTVRTTPANLSGFACLHFLELSRVEIADATVSNIISNCCALKSLILAFCDQLIHLTVTCSQLLNLDVDFCDGLISVCIHADNLEAFMYKGHKINIEYKYATFLDTLRVHFIMKNQCPLDFISALPKLPKLETLILQFSGPVQVSRALRHTFRFANLKMIVFFLVKSWKECICSLAYLLKAAPSLEYFGVHGFSKLKEQPSELNMTWPEDLTFVRLHIIVVKGFSGEPELMELLYFLLRRAPALKSLQLETRAYEPFLFRKEKHKSEDEERCRYATEMASTHLAPKVPSTVAFSIT